MLRYKSYYPDYTCLNNSPSQINDINILNFNEIINEISSLTDNSDVKNLVLNIISKRELSIQDFDIVCDIVNKKFNIFCHKKVQHINTKERLYVIGDIHGSLNSLLIYFLISGGIKNNVFVFLGDYLDRGDNGLEVICLIVLLRILYPTQIYIIIGNHELRSVYKINGTYREFARKLNTQTKYDPFDFQNPINIYLNKLDEIINGMCFCIVINDKIFCCHGCPTESTDLLELDTVEIPKEIDPFIMQEYTPNHNLMNQNLEDLLWSDPCSLNGERSAHSPRGCGKLVPLTIIENFLKINKFDLLLRAHQCTQTGIFRHSDFCITLFGTPNYCGVNNNAGCCVIDGSYKTYKFLSFSSDDVKKYIPDEQSTQKNNEIFKEYFG
ncbi:serine/threonine-protein phosphatase [Bodo saltans virus]|uniref:protein-serine/threonine phosphatase n=1 Tax=Bodo saltans virus TaxID=2024608 RepID=A0A2H4UVT0_9VIRU|nr:serine/threonine-protein phosphatase [Bodo saltans virus]ATZ80976.1 serine/threonine-protein phosphatase [Bodo saltans virus]